MEFHEQEQQVFEGLYLTNELQSHDNCRSNDLTLNYERVFGACFLA